MKVIDRSITAWQTGIILFIILFANKILILPSLLYDGAKIESFFIPIILFCFDFALLFLFYKIKNKFPNQSFEDIINQYCARWVRILVYLAFAIFFFGKTILLYNVTYIFSKNMIYKDSGNFIILFAILPVINHLAICGLRVLGRTAQLFFPVIVGITLFSIIVGIMGFNSVPLFFQVNASQFFLTFFKHISPFGDTIILFLFMDKIKIDKGQWKVVFSLFGLACFLVVTIIIVFLISYTYTSFMHPFALFELMSYVKEYEGLGRIDLISMVIIIIFTYFHLTIYLKAFMASFHGIFNKLDWIYSILTFNLLFLVIVNFFVMNLEIAIFVGENILPFITIFPFIILPFIIAIIFYKHKRRRIS